MPSRRHSNSQLGAIPCRRATRLRPSSTVRMLMVPVLIGVFDEREAVIAVVGQDGAVIIKKIRGS
jgi:hypothetical protein